MPSPFPGMDPYIESKRQTYLRKRRALSRSEVHVMELDLLRGGERSPLETAVICWGSLKSKRDKYANGAHGGSLSFLLLVI
jgi:hypothetical protein